MKKSTLWILITIAVLPAMLLLLVLTISGVSITKFPLWFLILMPTLLIATPFLYLFVQRFAQQKIHDQPIEKRKKPLLTAMGIYIFFSAIIVIAAYFLCYDYFWIVYLAQSIIALFFMFLRYKKIVYLKKV
ncbi:MAG: hypothetical protein LBM67_07880 [Lentimicrobiaceae bacterium]|nr:hypothetical protein [Lentimicrobiaceae bacterium]